ncbi:MAG: dicarboxylate/amino acid:cation symporter [Ignavibacteriaceae bacterium]
MKIKYPSLQTQIVLALILGALFGALFNVSHNKLIINYKDKSGNNSVTVQNWNAFIVVESNDTILFKKNSQIQIVNLTRKFQKADKPYKVLVKEFYDSDSEKTVALRELTEVTSVLREKTIATSIKWIGDIFIRLLNMIAIPLVLASLTVGAASLGDVKKFARIGGKTLLIYITTTMFAVTTGLFVANLFQPGEKMPAETKNNLLSVYEGDIQQKLETQLEFDFAREIVNIIPKNPIEAMATANMMQIVFFAVILGMILTMIAKEKSDPVVTFLDGLSETMIKMVDVIMKIAPYGVFALIASTVSEFGWEILATLIWYSLTVVVGLVIHTFITYAVLIKLFTKVRIKTFYKAMRRAMTIGFSTSSSAATLPVTMECCQENLGISKSVTSFVLPLGATINMDGTALYQGVAAVFIAQVFGIDLTLTQQIVIVFTATLASIGTAPVPGVGLIMMIIILNAVGIPQEGLALILGVDRILDMCRTITNITGDAMTATIIATGEKENLIT